MRKALLGTAAAVALAGFSLVSAAHAQAPCTWNGFNWVCAPDYNYNPQYYGPYPHASQGSSSEITGYKPPWLPSYVGPRPSSGAGH